MKLSFFIVIVLALALGCGALWLSAGPLHQQARTSSETSTVAEFRPLAVFTTSTPTIGTVSATPTVITVNTSTIVKVTAQITDPTLIPGSVNLLRLGATGTQPTILGVMNDDGKNGDAVAEDRVYTFQAPFNEATTGHIQLQVSAAFRGRLQRLLSPIFSVQVWNQYSNSAFGFTINIPPTWTAHDLVYAPYFSDLGFGGVLDIGTALASGTLQQMAQASITNNNCPADWNGQPTDHIISTSTTGVLYVLYCSESSEVYTYIFLNRAGQVVVFAYHDDFDSTASEGQKIVNFEHIISSLHVN